MRDVHARRSAISDGCLVEGCDLEDTLLGIRSVVRAGSKLRRCYVMGAGTYETDSDHARNYLAGIPDLGVGAGTTIENAIIDKDCRIGQEVRLVNEGGLEEYEDVDRGVYIREGVIVVARGAVIPRGFEI